MSEGEKDPVALNVVPLDTSGLDKESIFKRLSDEIDNFDLESLTVIGIGRRQGISMVFTNLGYDPVRMLGALDMAQGQVAGAAYEFLGLTTDE